MKRNNRLAVSVRTYGVDQKPKTWDVQCDGTCGIVGCIGHIVVRNGGALACNCPAGVYGQLCKHVRATYWHEMRDMGFYCRFGFATESQAKATKNRIKWFVVGKARRYVVVRRVPGVPQF